MTCVYITSDWHLGHRAIAKYREYVSSVEENTQILLNNYRAVVTKRDMVWFLGDIVFDENLLQLVKDLPGTKKLVLGNHCTDKKIKTSDLVEVFDEVHGFVKYKKAWLSHCPIHPSELRGRINIHGHTHYTNVNDDRYFNVCVEQTNMFPKKYQDIPVPLKM